MLDKWFNLWYNIIVPRENKINCRKAERGIFMAEMKKAERLAKAKEIVIEHFKDLFETLSAEKVKDFEFSIPVEVGGNEQWVNITITAKDMMTDDEGKKVPYDPFVVQAMYQAEKEIKEAEKAERERKKAETLKKAEEKKRLAKEKALAKKANLDRRKAEVGIVDGADEDAE